MKKLVIYVAFIIAVVVTSVATFVVADSLKFFLPGVPYSAQVHQGLSCGAVVFAAGLIDIGACLAIYFCGTDTSHNPQA